MTPLLKIISAGAAMGLVKSLLADRVDYVSSSFGAVGAMQDKFEGGQACDVLILSRKQLESLMAKGALVEDSIADLGCVYTGLAVRTDHPNPPQITDTKSLKASLDKASGLFVPDMSKSTAGQHVAKILTSLGLLEAMKPRMAEHPNGATAMRVMSELAPSQEQPLGCTQATEILYTAGVKLIGLLPKEFKLATLYSVAVPKRHGDWSASHAALQALSHKPSEPARLAAGFQTK